MTHKKRIGIIIFLLLLCACEKQVETENNENSIIISEEIQSTTDLNDSQETLESEENPELRLPKNEVISIAQTFQSVLFNEKEFLCIEQSPYDDKIHIIEYKGFLNDMPYRFTKQTSIDQFAVIDMDGDTIPEVVLAIENYSGYIILHYREGEIYGNFVDYRAMGSLNKNGAFETAAGATDIGIEKLYFIGNVFVTNEGARRTSIDSFYVHDIITDEKTWYEICDLFDQSSKVEWHEYTEDSVNKWIVKNPSFPDMPTEILKSISERQQYLDSLFYLIEQTHGLLSVEKDKEDAQEYFDSRINELNKIYQLCQEKFSGEELKALEEEQKHWEDNFKQRLNEELELRRMDSIEELKNLEYRYLYCQYGDIIFRRTLELINLYYDFHFYDSLY